MESLVGEAYKELEEGGERGRWKEKGRERHGGSEGGGGRVDRRRKRRRGRETEKEGVGGREGGEDRGEEGRRGERYLDWRHEIDCSEVKQTVSRNIKEKSGATFQNC